MPTEFKNEIIKMICQRGRKCFGGDDESLQQFSDDDISPFDQHAVEKRNRLIDLACILDEPSIDLSTLRQSVFHGIPFLRDDMTIWIKDKDIKTLPITQQISHCFRAITWRMMLGTLGFDNQKWREQIFQNIETYELWKQEFIKDARYMESLYTDKDEFRNDYQTARAEHRATRIAKIRGDKLDKEKLAALPKKKFENEWNNFFADNDLWDEIWKDVRRTRTEIGFFKLPLDPNKKLTTEDLDRLEMQFETPKMDLTADDLDNYIRTHSDVLARILFVYAKLNAGLKYVQGMNEVLAVVYYCFWLGGSLVPQSYAEEQAKAKESSQISSKAEGAFPIDFMHFEADVFSAFSSVMADLRDGFIRELDKEASGLQGHIQHFDRVLRVVDQPVWSQIAEEAQVSHQFYTLRWFMLLMCQEFELLCVLRLWDTLTAAEGPALTSAELVSAGAIPSNQEDFKIQRFEFIDYVAVALVQQRRKEILAGDGDFAIVMEQLQATSGTVKSLDDIEALLAESVKVCLHWMRWLVGRTTGKRKKRGGGGQPVKWTNYLTKGRNDDEDEDDEQLESEYGEEVALEKYGAAKVYEKIILQKR